MAEHDDSPRKAGRKRPLELIGVRVEPDIVARLEALRPRLSPPWHEMNRSDIVRMILVFALPAIEDDADGIRKELVNRGRSDEDTDIDAFLQERVSSLLGRDDAKK